MDIIINILLANIIFASRGPNWGDNGFIKIRRGTNECGIEQVRKFKKCHLNEKYMYFCNAKVCVVTDCAANGSADEAPPTPTTTAPPVNLQCDVTGLFGPGITGNYNFRLTSGNQEFLSEVSCEDSICRPRVPGPSNACMYICGKTTC